MIYICHVWLVLSEDSKAFMKILLTCHFWLTTFNILIWYLKMERSCRRLVVLEMESLMCHGDSYKASVDGTSFTSFIFTRELRDGRDNQWWWTPETGNTLGWYVVVTANLAIDFQYFSCLWEIRHSPVYKQVVVSVWVGSHRVWKLVYERQMQST